MSPVRILAFGCGTDLWEFREDRGRVTTTTIGEIVLRHHFREECPLICGGSVPGLREKRERVDLQRDRRQRWPCGAGSGLECPKLIDPSRDFWERKRPETDGRKLQLLRRMDNPFPHYFTGGTSELSIDRDPVNVDPLKKYDSLGTGDCDQFKPT